MTKEILLKNIYIKMVDAGLPELFVVSAIELAFEFEGIYDLLVLWYEETDEQEKEATIKDLKDMIDICTD